MKLLELIKEHKQDIILAAGVVLISLISFAMGYIAAKSGEKLPLRFEDAAYHINLRIIL